MTVWRICTYILCISLTEVQGKSRMVLVSKCAIDKQKRPEEGQTPHENLSLPTLWKDITRKPAYISEIRATDSKTSTTYCTTLLRNIVDTHTESYRARPPRRSTIVYIIYSYDALAQQRLGSLHPCATQLTKRSSAS